MNETLAILRDSGSSVSKSHFRQIIDLSKIAIIITINFYVCTVNIFFNLLLNIIDVSFVTVLRMKRIGNVFRRSFVRRIVIPVLAVVGAAADGAAPVVGGDEELAGHFGLCQPEARPGRSADVDGAGATEGGLPRLRHAVAVVAPAGRDAALLPPRHPLVARVVPGSGARRRTRLRRRSQ